MIGNQRISKNYGSKGTDRSEHEEEKRHNRPVILNYDISILVINLKTNRMQLWCPSIYRLT